MSKTATGEMSFSVYIVSDIQFLLLCSEKDVTVIPYQHQHGMIRSIIKPFYFKSTNPVDDFANLYSEFIRSSGETLLALSDSNIKITACPYQKFCYSNSNNCFGGFFELFWKLGSTGSEFFSPGL